MRAVFFWERTGLSVDEGNPYGGLLADAMKKLGVEMEAKFLLEAEWLKAHRGRVQVLHLNHLQRLYMGEDLKTTTAQCAEFVGNVMLARHLGYKVVLTIHNLYPHERPYPELDRMARLVGVEAATAVIVHCGYGAELVREHFFRKEGVFVIPHGNFIACYPNTISQTEARRRLNIPERNFVYLFIGNVRPYKGIEDLLEAFSSIPGEDLTLLLAARVPDGYREYGEPLMRRTQGYDERMVLYASAFFPNEELQIYLNAADVVVLPFTDTLTSGSAILALSFKRPVLAPAMGCLPELIDNEIGMLYDSRVQGALKQAMEEIRHKDLQQMNKKAYQKAKNELNWDDIAQMTIQAYQYP